MSIASFTAELQKGTSKGSWTYVVWPESVSFFGTRGLVKVKVAADGHAFKTSFMAMGNGNHMLPIKAEIRKQIKKDVGDKIDNDIIETIASYD